MRVEKSVQSRPSALPEPPLAAAEHLWPREMSIEDHLPLLAAERHKLLVQWNQTCADYPAEKCFHQLFEEQAERTPQAVAALFGEERLTYRQLNRRAGELARSLQVQGVGPEVLVGICLRRSLELLVGVLAILKAGGAYLPLDPAWPKERMREVLEDAQPPLLLTDQSLLGNLKLEIPNLNILCLDAPDPVPRFTFHVSHPMRPLRESRTQTDHSSTPHSALRTPRSGTLAYVLYTSGSTGRPKGVMIEHRSLVNYLCWCVRAYPFCAGEGVPVQSSIAFDFTITSLLGPLLAGSTVHLLPEEHGVEALRNALRGGKRFSLIKITPAHLELLSQQLSPSEVAGCARAFVIGGENLPGELLVFWQQHAPDTALFNEYGPTEAAVGCCVYETPKGRRISGSVPIGRPIANTRAFVLDRLMQPVPVGAQGELCLAGDGLARGYLHRPDLTAERFFPDPFSQQAGARLYRTGDLARWLPDGTLEFLGRLDRQVKIRGFRVELEEVEAALAGHPSVRDCATLMQEGARGGKRLVAYVVPREARNRRREEADSNGKLLEEDDEDLAQPGSAGILAGEKDARQLLAGKDAGAPRSGADQIILTPAAARPRVTELRRFLEEKLPPYALPASFVFLERLPLTANGKVDRGALPTPGLERQAQDKPVAPNDDTELRLTRLWEEVLGVCPISRQERFTDLGGHSLQAARLTAKIEQTFGKTISAATLCEVQTIERLAQLLRGERIGQSDSSIVAIQPGDSAPPLFFVHGLGGGMLWGYTNLSRHLGPAQPVYAFKSRGSDQLEEFSRIEEMAAHYVADLRAFRPNGPYCLGGYCFGGNVAYEMARQFRARGQSVSLLALFNSMSPNSSYFKARWSPGLALKFMQNSWHWLRYFGQWRPEQRRDFFRRKARLLKKKARRWFGASNPEATSIEARDWLDLSQYAEYERKLWDIHIRNLRDYVPKPYAGHLTLFRTRVHPFFCSFDPTFGWAELAEEGVTVKLVPGGHESILEEPHVGILARELLAILPGTGKA